MSAPMNVSSKQPQNKNTTIRANTDEKKKAQSSQKNVLKSPFANSWPFVPQDLENDILHKLKECFPIKLQPVFDSNKERKLHRQLVKDNKLTQDQIIELEKRKQMRRELTIGINSTTKALEQNKLQLVIVTREPKIKILVEHILPLVAVRNCPAIRLPNLTENIFPVTGIKSLSVLGFKKQQDNSLFDDFVKFVIKNAPPVIMSWLQDAAFLSVSTDLTKNNELEKSKEAEVAESMEILKDTKVNNVPMETQFTTSEKALKVKPSVKKDYSYLYIYKMESKLGDDFISVSSSGTTEEDYFPTDSKKKKREEKFQLLSFKYRGIEVGTMKKNENRKTKKKK